jgi:hypothetical protein
MSHYSKGLKMRKITIVTLTCLFALPLTAGAEKNRQPLYPKVRKYVESAINEFDQIQDQRKRELETLAFFIRNRLKDNKPVNLTFICTHNSRRSHMSQIWAQIAAVY